LLPLAALLSLVASTPEAAAQASRGSVDQSDPAKVVEALFDAARSGRWAQLGGLCDPRGENDGDTRRVCALAQDGADRAEFQQFFRHGRVSGAVAIQGDRARVPILFGPDGSRNETVTLIRRGSLWYLLGF
jgi:hypothetical protein